VFEFRTASTNTHGPFDARHLDLVTPWLILPPHVTVVTRLIPSRRGNFSKSWSVQSNPMNMEQNKKRQRVVFVGTHF
jgi:hypothetical protein